MHLNIHLSFKPFNIENHMRDPTKCESNEFSTQWKITAITYHAKVVILKTNARIQSFLETLVLHYIHYRAATLI